MFSIGDQIVEALQAHELLGRAEARRRRRRCWTRWPSPHAGRRLDDYPHEFSGGSASAAPIAIAIAALPLLIADEPTTALDVTIQAQILEPLSGERSYPAALILITHDLGVVAELRIVSA